MEEKEFLTIRDAAKLLACSEKQIRRYIEKSVLKAANIGLGKRRIYRIPREAMDSFVQERMTGALKGGQAKD
jgi:excisionase family DNA binding protein